ncbi:MAG TPA: sulfotransferase [Gaiellales bacterium]|nr:sulfotransferase [Gaiellales bacterium]
MSQRPTDEGTGRARSTPRIDAPLFLVSSERSGSTLMRLMLDHHPGIAFASETDFVVERVSDAGERPPVMEYADWLTTVRAFDYKIDRSLDYDDLVNDFLRQKQRSSADKPLVGATVHRQFHRLRFLWPNARYIHLIRDPRDVSRSVTQKGWAGNVYQAAEFWINAEGCWDALLPHLDSGQFVELHYEDLVTRPQSELARVCGFIGVEFDPSMLEYQKTARQYPPPDPTLAFRWKSKMAPGDVALVESRTGRLLERRGYHPSGVPPVRVGAARRARLLGDARAREFGTRISRYGARVALLDMFGRRLGLSRAASRARARINAIDQHAIDLERAGLVGPSSDIAPVGPASGDAAAADRGSAPT